MRFARKHIRYKWHFSATFGLHAELCAVHDYKYFTYHAKRRLPTKPSHSTYQHNANTCYGLHFVGTIAHRLAGQ